MHACMLACLLAFWPREHQAPELACLLACLLVLQLLVSWPSSALRRRQAVASVLGDAVVADVEAGDFTWLGPLGGSGALVEELVTVS